MPVTYGVPLPPGTDAATKGEVRIRIDKLILDDEAINHNPCFPSAAERFLGGHPDMRSPNTFVIPMDHCAVAPLFCGESKPSVSVVPTTPGEARGSFTIVHAIKVSPDEFDEYLHRMATSPHKGVQLEVFVPSSFSGRSPMPVGKAIVNLEGLAPRHSINGWFTVGASVQRYHDQDGHPKGEPSAVVLPVGRVKVSFTVVFFSNPVEAVPSRRTRSRGAAQRTSSSLKREAAGEATSYAAYRTVLDSPDTSPHHEAAATNASTPPRHSTAEAPAAERSTGTASGGLASVLPDSKGLPVKQQEAATPRDSHDSSALMDILEQGTSLQARMAEAVATPGRCITRRAVPVDERSSRALGSEAVCSSLVQAAESFVQRGTPKILEDIGVSIPTVFDPEASFRGKGYNPHHALESGVAPESEDTTLYTSEDSDEERFTVQLEKSVEEQRENQAEAVRGGRTAIKSSIPQPLRHDISEATMRPSIAGGAADGSSCAAQPYRHENLSSNPLAASLAVVRRVTVVELDFSQISFARTSLNQDLEEMRINVCLSKDISTEHPTAGPFSSFVHQIPLSQHRICLSFAISSYSEENSKLVVEFFKVKSRPIPPPGATLLPPNPQLPREVVSETPLGLCIVGLFKQERDIAIQDPIHNCVNAYAHMILRLLHQPPCRGAPVQRSPDSGSRHVNASQTAEQSDPDTPAVGEDAPSQHAGAVEEEDGAHSGDHTSIRRSRPTPMADGTLSTSSSIQRWPEQQVRAVPGGNSQHERSTPSFSRAPQAEERSKRSATVRQSQESSGLGGVVEEIEYGESPLDVQHSFRAATSVGSWKHRVPSSPAPHASAPLELSGRRCRFHVAILSAKQVPQVAVVQRRDEEWRLAMAPASEMQQLQAGAKSILSPSGTGMLALFDSKRNQFRHPNVVFVVEEIYSGVDGHAASTGAVKEWAVEATTGGVFDRTAVVRGTASPVFHYESVLSLPLESVILTQTPSTPSRRARHLDTGERSLLQRVTEGPTAALKPCLRELQLTMWHALDEQDMSFTPREAGQSEEEHFWSNAAYMGECRVDLRPLKHMSSLQGYYRVTATGNPSLKDPARLPTSASSTVGYVHIAVSLLPSESTEG